MILLTSKYLFVQSIRFCEFPDNYLVKKKQPKKNTSLK